VVAGLQPERLGAVADGIGALFEVLPRELPARVLERQLVWLPSRQLPERSCTTTRSCAPAERSSR
jgi:hypothetical protein